MTQVNFLIQHVLELTTLETVLSFPPELVDQTEILEPLASSDINYIYFNTNIKVNNDDKQGIRRNIYGDNYANMREYLGDLEGNEQFKNNSLSEC